MMKKSMTLMAGMVATVISAPVAFADSTASTMTPIFQTAETHDLQTAVNNMEQTELSKMHEWTALAAYAGGSPLMNTTWTKTETAKFTATTDAARFILGLLAAGQDPHNELGQNVVTSLAKAQILTGANAGKFADNLDGTGTDLINAQSWAIIALEDAGGATYNRVAAAQWLIAQQNKDGGFGYSSQYNSSDVDDTASAIVALTLLGYSADSAPIQSAVTFLRTQQVSDGGFKNGADTSNASSTGLAIDALEAVGIDPTTWSQQSGTPISSLLSFYDTKSGGFRYDNTGTEWSGVSGYSDLDAIMGLAAYMNHESVYQRLHWQKFSTLNAYWQNVYAHGGMWLHHQWQPWQNVRVMAFSGSYEQKLTPSWQSVIRAGGKNVTTNGHTTWESWDANLAKQALQASFGTDTLHLQWI